MPKGIYSHYFKCKKGEKHPKFTPTKIQKNVVKYFLNVTYPSKTLKGLLLYHKLGAGKTCTSILTSDNMIEQGKITKVYVFTPGSLRKNWLDEYCKTCGVKAEYLKRFYTFITYNYTIGWGLDDLDFDDSIIIIDEIHNIINGVINAIKNKNKAQRDSKTAFKIYKKLKTSNCKILALSGTPIYNNIYEWSLLGNLLKPKSFPSIDGDKLIFLPEKFMKLFDENDNGEVTPKNPLQFNTDLQGIISYYPGKKGDFPDVIHMDPIQVYMTDVQNDFYWEQHVKQNMYKIPPSQSLKRRDPELYKFLHIMSIRANLYQFTRSASNFYYPPEFREIYVSKNKRQTGAHPENEDDFVDVSGRKDALVENDGWISKENLRYNPEDEDEEVKPGGKLYNIYSTKIVALIANILLNFKTKHVVFTYFKNKYGAKLISSLFKLCDVPTLIYSGDLNDKEREKVLRIFNSVENRYGKIAKVLIVTGAGAEGISILEARHMHILESGPTPNIIQQAMGRVARYKSHAKLPPNERKVKIWRYWSVSKDGNTIVKTTIKNKEGQVEDKFVIIPHGTPTVDKFLFDRGEKKLNEINSFLKLLQKATVTPLPRN